MFKHFARPVFVPGGTAGATPIIDSDPNFRWVDGGTFGLESLEVLSGMPGIVAGAEGTSVREWSVQMEALDSGVYFKGTIHLASGTWGNHFGFWNDFIVPPREQGWWRVQPPLELTGNITLALGSGFLEVNSVSFTINLTVEAFQELDGQRVELSRQSTRAGINAFAVDHGSTGTIAIKNPKSFPELLFPIDRADLDVHVALTVEFAPSLTGDSRVTLADGVDTPLGQSVRVAFQPFKAERSAPPT